MALQIQFEFCSICFRSIAKRRQVKGSIRLKHSGSSASEVISYLLGERIPVISLCFRCYRLILGTDYHQHEFKRLRESLVKIYNERSPPVEKLVYSDYGRALIEAAHSSATDDSKLEVPLCAGGDLGIPPLNIDLNNEELLRCRFQDSSLIKSGLPLKYFSLHQGVEGQGESEQAIDIDKESYTEKKQDNDSCNSLVRSSKRQKRVKKLEDYDYYAETSKDADEKQHSNGNTLSEAVLSDTEAKNYCSLCCKDFALRKDYVSHHCMQVVEKDSLTCKGCQTSFSIRQLYTKHINMCYKNIPVKCHLCMVELQSAAYLPRHLEAFHNGISLTQKTSLCDQCGRTFSRKEALQRHQAKVHKISHGNFQCSKCGRTFLHTSLLMEHVRAHKGYQCSECKKMFTCMSNLTVHKRTYHLNKKLFFCAPCNKRWRFHTSYTNHMRKVHGRSQFKCPKCRLFFSAENAFEKHKEICVGVYRKPFADKFSSGMKALGKKDTTEEIVSDRILDSRTNVPIGISKVSDSSGNHARKYLRLKKVVRKVSSSSQSKVAVPPKRSGRVLRDSVASGSSGDVQAHSSALNSQNEMMMVPSTHRDSQYGGEGTNLPSPSEIVLEALDDISSECQYVILVEDSSEQK